MRVCSTLRLYPQKVGSYILLPIEAIHPHLEKWEFITNNSSSHEYVAVNIWRHAYNLMTWYTNSFILQLNKVSSIELYP